VDTRIARVEDNLLSLFAQVPATGLFEVEPYDDVLAYRSQVPLPLFNAITGARFTDGDRARALLTAYVQHGRPFMWWLTPSTSSPGIEAALAEAGLEPELVPGMHIDLPGRVTGPLPAGVALATVPPVQADTFVQVCLDGFEFPDFARQPMASMLGAVDPQRMRHLVATVDGTPAACGSLWLDGDVAGLYNITTLGAHRGRGLGSAVTRGLMDLATELGCAHAVLHASEMGLPVYERVGFVQVCVVPQWIWTPPA
jgi:ribosomal protein S18 acetylase RimI-like enzyme